ncbi:MAG: hypothetical protein IJU48_06980 [Synergistaceae bacterium]|nr:hypothetical protein [Synergistaceae bacterium]
MASYVHIQIRRDTGANWETNNPILKLGEIGCDMTAKRLKVGDGSTSWRDLSWIGPEVINDLITGGVDKALSAEKGKELNQKISDLEASIAEIISSGGVPVVDNLTSTSTTSALSANQGRVLNGKIVSVEEKVSGMGIFGMGYTIDEFNAYSKPTKITFEDGVTATLTWRGGTQLTRITASTGEIMRIDYDDDGLIIGRTVMRS